MPRRGPWICACALLQERGTDEPIASTPSGHDRMTHPLAPASRLRLIHLSDDVRFTPPVDGRGREPPEHRPMHRLPLVYTAAYAASGDQAVAEQVAERVLLAAA